MQLGQYNKKAAIIVALVVLIIGIFLTLVGVYPLLTSDPAGLNQTSVLLVIGVIAVIVALFRLLKILKT